MKRDLSRAQFEAKAAKEGFEGHGIMGYYKLPIPGHHICVSVWNAGERRRDQLNYLRRELRNTMKRLEATA